MEHTNNRLEKIIEVNAREALDGLPQEVVNHSIALLNKGRKFRAYLTLNTAQAFGAEDSDHVLKIAAALEMDHRASLIGDDLVDDDNLRNGIQTLHERFSSTEAVYVPMLILGHVNEMLTETVLQNEMSRAWRRGAIGQIVERHLGSDTGVTLDDYLRVVDRKSAGFAQFAFAAGHFLGTGSFEPDSPRQIGRITGRLLQVVDDMQDLFEVAEDSLPSDIKQGVRPAPWFFLSEDQRALQGHALLDAMKEEGVMSEVFAYAESLKVQLICELCSWMPDNDHRNEILGVIQGRWDRRTRALVRS